MNTVVTAQKTADGLDITCNSAPRCITGKEFCNLVTNGAVKHRSEKITSLSANGNGKGVVSIEIANNVDVAMAHRLLDYDDHMLMEVGQVFDKFLAHEENGLVISVTR